MPQNCAAIYAHIPFCARRCPYCDFAVSVNRSPEFHQKYVRALRREIEFSLQNRPPISSIYFGGGTPTTLAARDLNALLALLFQNAQIAPDAEISIEANPENLSLDYLRELRAGGWNRISLGAQSLDDASLQQFGRAHRGQDVENALQNARAASFENVSLDLIYGEPLTPPSVWRQTLRRAAQFDVTHVSCYSLTVEDGTQFGVRARRGELKIGDDDSFADLMEMADEILRTNGFSRYEVSNWARPGFESRHNQNYWRGGDYFGLGCGAHGHFAGHRFWNERDAKTYVLRLENGQNARAGEEFLGAHERLSEFLALGLRTREGFDLDEISRRLGPDAAAILTEPLAKMEKLGVLRREGSQIIPSEKSLAIADGIALKLLQGIETLENSGVFLKNGV